jgi:putative Mg2+ transporter-C (MgtC) family protein
MGNWLDTPLVPGDWNTLASSLEMLIRLLLAIAGGACLGWERTAKDKPAGLRTHMLVSLGAAISIVATLQLSGPGWTRSGALPMDISRVIAGIVGGIGFLGAGAIIKHQHTVEGITTAASIWVSAAIGVACGLGQYSLAITSAVLALIILWTLGWIEDRLFPAPRYQNEAANQLRDKPTGGAASSE